MMDTTWLSEEERAAWVRLVAIVELLPGALDTQLRDDSDLSHFEYFALAMLSEAPDATLRMTELALRTNATLPRLSHVVRRLEARGLVDRRPCEDDRRATDARLTQPGWDVVRVAAPGHVALVRRLVMDVLSPGQVRQLRDIGDAVLAALDPAGRLSGLYGDRPRPTAVRSGSGPEVGPGSTQIG